jgi:plastocyanin
MLRTERSTSHPWLAALIAGGLLLGACGGGGGGEQAAAPAEPAAGGEAAPAQPAGPAGPTGTASIAGTVTYAGAMPSLPPIQMNADPACAAKHDTPVPPQMLVLGDGNTMGNIFLKVSNAPQGSYPVPSGKAEIDQEGCMYHPHVLGMMAGQELEFKNSDALLHNVHGLPKENREFNIGMPASLTEKSVTLNRPEPLFTVKCDVHPWMNAYVAVMSHPFWDVTEPDGQFTIGDLPAGTYTVEAWHEKLGTRTAEVTVADGESATVDFSFEAPSG